MTLINATSLNDQVDYLSTNDFGQAKTNANSIFNSSPRNAVVEDDDDDDIDETIPDPDEDELFDDDESFPDEPDAVDDFDDADIIDDDELDDDDDKGSTTSGLNHPRSFSDRPQGRTTGRMTDHEPGSGTANNL